MRASRGFRHGWGAGVCMAFMLAGLLAPLRGIAQDPTAGPEKLVVGMVSATVEAMKAEREALHGTFGAATGHAIATRLIAPHVDFERLTRDAVGPAWESATPAQRATLHAQFRTLLLHVTGKILASYNDELLAVEAYKPGANPNEAEIRIKVTATRYTGDEPPEPMFVSLYKTDAGWRIFDLRAEGVSVSRLYAGNFKVVLGSATGSPAGNTATRSEALDKLIRLLEERNKLNAAQAGRTF